MNFTTKKVLVFDKDDTVTSTKSCISPEMANILAELSRENIIAIISGSSWETIRSQIVDLLPEKTDLKKWYFLPASGSQLYHFDKGSFGKIYDHTMDISEYKQIREQLLAVFNELPEDEKPSKIYSEQVENRLGQITMSALGQVAPKNLKIAWDPDRSKRKKMAKKLAKQLPNYDIKIGGSTSIDVTKHGINKEFGVRQLLNLLQVSPSHTLFFGDSLEPGGNDEVVRNISGLEVVPVESEIETLEILQKHPLLSS